MRYRPLGRSGLVVSAVGLGCNNFGRRLDLAATTHVIDACFNHGITLFDTADTYGAEPGESETLIGQALNSHRSRRDEIVLATKFGNDMRGAYGGDHGARGSRRYIRRAIEGSLRRLQTDHIDLYQYHRPDGVTPLEETLGALHELVLEGKVRYIGSSNFPAWWVSDAAWIARSAHQTPLVSEQSEYSLLRRGAEKELLPACERHGVGFLPYFPLASGALTGKVRRGQPAPEGSRLRDSYADVLTDEAFDVIEALDSYAKARGIKMIDVAIGVLAAQPAVGSVIAGATKPEQVAANAAADDWRPTEEDLAALSDVLPPAGG